MSKKVEINSGRASPTQLEAPPRVADPELGQVLPPGAKAPERPGNYMKVRNLEDPPSLTGKIYRRGIAVPHAKVNSPAASKEAAHIAINVAPPKKSCAVSGGFRKTNGSKKARKSQKASRKSKKSKN
uniref:Uncharacterized protein n=1 Tax=viral metagenome TaxID=1070528 RepID=A0A6C0KP60_9ZZZZ